jgi:hypothetical protein
VRLGRIMQIDIKEFNGILVGEINSNETVLNDVGDALDIIGNCNYQGCSKIIIKEQNLNPDFFDLKTGMAGEILQKFSTYRSQAAIVGDFSKYPSKSLKDFIFESNKRGRIFFVGSMEEARDKLLDG